MKSRLLLQHTLHSPLKQMWLRLQQLPLDAPLLLMLLLLASLDLMVLYSASQQNLHLVGNQAAHFAVGLLLMVLVAHLSPNTLQHWAPRLYGISLALLVVVLVMGVIGKGAQRWLDLGLIRFQPSEMAKITSPMFLAWFFSQERRPSRYQDLLLAILALVIPVMLVAKQPDLGTAVMIACGGLTVIFLAGLSVRLVGSACLLGGACLPILWYFMHDYQKQRILTFLNPERDPLGSGYHIIQSKIAIGSGGLFGKGWLQGTQSHLHFLPENTTDFIFSVIGEEWGLLGALCLLGLFALIIWRLLTISLQAQTAFTRLLAGALSCNFFCAVFVNMGMVSGILPVVGLPLPLVSYGGTAVVSNLIAFGLMIAIHRHRTLLPT